MLQKIGFFMMCIGGTIADSDCILVPIAVTGIGAVLLWISMGEEADDETA
jgi:hypothetical protein